MICGQEKPAEKTMSKNVFVTFTVTIPETPAQCCGKYERASDSLFLVYSATWIALSAIVEDS